MEIADSQWTVPSWSLHGYLVQKYDQLIQQEPKKVVSATLPDSVSEAFYLDVEMDKLVSLMLKECFVIAMVRNEITAVKKISFEDVKIDEAKLVVLVQKGY